MSASHRPPGGEALTEAAGDPFRQGLLQYVHLMSLSASV
jgi:hypothetical protein